MSEGFLDTATWWLALFAWVAWLLLGSGRMRIETGDKVRDRGTRVWVTAFFLGSVFVAVALAMVPCWADFPGPPWALRAFGSLVALLGIGLREWAVITLGRFFTQTVMIREGHRVVTSGPYQFLRHPAYAGTLVTVVGLVLTLGNWVGLVVAIVGFFVSHVPRIRVEEKTLEQSLGEPYLEFERTRKRLIPGLW